VRRRPRRRRVRWERRRRGAPTPRSRPAAAGRGGDRFSTDPGAVTALFEADFGERALRLRIVSEDDPDWDGDACPDVAEPHPYSVAVAFPDALVPERVVVRHGDETVLEGNV
jgi:hypothetical protein